MMPAIFIQLAIIGFANNFYANYQTGPAKLKNSVACSAITHA